jgi:hypothetical protein
MGRDFIQDSSETILSDKDLALAEALGDYLERRNSGQVPEIGAFLQEYPSISEDLAHSLALLEIPRKVVAVELDVEAAWKVFRARVFTGEQAKAASLGSYVQQALEVKDRDLTAAALSPETLAAMQTDQTPVQDLKGYDLNDYATLARRYGVKDAAFPKLLKWLKNVTKSFGLPAVNQGRGMAFARAEQRKRGVTEAEIAQVLEQEQAKDVNDGEAETTEKE